MHLDALVEGLPLWVLLPSTLLLALLSVEGGFRFGRHRSHRSPDREGPLASMVAATLGLVGFLLAFSFGLASSRFDARRELFLEEVNAIETTYLRAQLLPEPERTETRDLLRQYVDIRIEAVRPEDIPRAILQSVSLHDALWSLAVAANDKTSSPVFGLFIQSLNDVINLHSKRVVAGLRSRIPSIIWLVLYSTVALAMLLMGYHLGLKNRNRSIAIPAFALAFSVVLLLIADLDRPLEGLIKVNQEAIQDLRRTMKP